MRRNAAKIDRASAARISKMKKLASRDSLVYLMSRQFGLTDFQIAHTYIKDRSGRSFIIPGMSDSPSGLAEAAMEYIRNYRGSDPGPLIRRLIVMPSVDRNQPMEPRDIGRIHAEWAEVLEAKKKIDAERVSSFENDGEAKSRDSRESECVSNAAIASESTSTNNQARRDTSEPLTSISVPRSLLYRLRRMSTEASEREGRHVPSYELVTRALDAIDCFRLSPKSSSEDSDKERRA